MATTESNLIVGTASWIPQWEHTRHNGYAVVVGEGKGSREGKVSIRWPDGSVNLNNKKQIVGQINDGLGVLSVACTSDELRRLLDCQWIQGEMAEAEIVRRPVRLPDGTVYDKPLVGVQS